MSSNTTKETGSGEKVHAVDLFCGAGGLSTALALACEDLDRPVELSAVNHDADAISTHKENHPWANHYNTKVEELHPPNVVNGEEVDILIAAPECTHFSRARGGSPVEEQLRASPFHVIDWAGKTNAQSILIENVPELEQWGPLDDDGNPTRNGEIFDAWINMLHAMGYSVDWKVLNAADYGDPTSRERLFIICRKNHQPDFPEQTHSESGEKEDTEPWRTASEIINWSDEGESIWERSRPLVNNTMRRIAEGVRRHGSKELQPFADAISELEKEDVEEMQKAVVESEDIDQAVNNREKPFLARYKVAEIGAEDLVDIDPESITEISEEDNDTSESVPYILRQQSGGNPPSTDTPLPTIATKAAIAKIEAEAFVLPRNGFYRGLHSNPSYKPEDRPLHTVTAKNHDGHVVEPYLVPYFGERKGQRPRTHDISDPLPTVTATGAQPYVSKPFIIQYYGQSDETSVDEPLPTVTTKDRFALIVPEMYPQGIDVKYRMLEPPELAAAMGFPEDYKFVGNKTETKSQIGNAVPVNLGTALCKHILTSEAPDLDSYGTSEAPA